MKLTINWFKHPTEKNAITGICPILPDVFCQFKIMKMSDGNFWILLPTMATDNFDKRIILRDPEMARDFCLDFLNYNQLTIIRYQIREMQRRSVKGDKTVWYYENLLNEVASFDSLK